MRKELLIVAALALPLIAAGQDEQTEYEQAWNSGRATGLASGLCMALHMIVGVDGATPGPDGVEDCNPADWAECREAMTTAEESVPAACFNGPSQDTIQRAFVEAAFNVALEESLGEIEEFSDIGEAPSELCQRLAALLPALDAEIVAALESDDSVGSMVARNRRSDIEREMRQQGC